jgi:polysaccharide biosynthesis transport protein
METEQVSQILSVSKRGKQLQELPSVEKEEVNASPQKGLNFRPLLRTIQRKALLIIGIAGIVGGGTFYWAGKNIPPEYEGSFRLLVEPVTNEARIVEPSALARAQGQTSGGQISNLDYSTQLEVLKSPEMLTKIYDKVKVKYPGISYFSLDKGLSVQRLVDPKSPEPTKIIEVRYGAKDPAEVKFVLKTVSDEFLKYSLNERKTQIDKGAEFIDEQLRKELNPRVNDLQSRLQTLQQQYKLSDPKTQAEQILTQLREITTQQAQTQRDLQEQKSLYVSLQKQLELTPDEAVAASALSEDPNYRTLQAKIQELDNQIAVESSRFLPNSPTIQSLQDKRQNLVALGESESQRILGQNLARTTNNPQVQSFQNSVRIGLIQKMVESDNQIKMLEIRNQSLGRTRSSIERQAQQFPLVARQYTDIQGQLEIANRTREQLLTQRETLRVEAAQKQYPWQLIAPPGIPTDPKGNLVPGPSKSKNIKIMGVLGGLVLGILVAIFIEKLRDIFYSSKELKESLPLPLLGEIPLYKSANQLLSSNAFAESLDETASRNKSASPFLEAFDSLYANIRFLFSDPPIRSLAICSAASGDGKSTVALHLAQTAATMGQRVLLVDANFRRPQIHSRLDLPNPKGLSDLLAKKLPPDELIQRSPLADNLFVLTSGQPLPNSTKLLASAHMQYLMEEFQATFDLVIYDTSHLASFRDANFLAAHTDGVLMVVGVGKTNRSGVMQVLNQLNTYRLPTLGIVANHVKKGANRLASNDETVTDLKIVDDELQVPHSAGKWIDFEQDKVNNRKSSQ